MFAQIFIVVMGVFLIVTGVTNTDYIPIAVGVLVAMAAGSTLYKLKSGK